MPIADIQDPIESSPALSAQPSFVRWALLYVIGGAVAFWAPCVVGYIIYEFTGSWAVSWELIFIAPFPMTVIVHLLFLKHSPRLARIDLAALSMGLGIWISGPTANHLTVYLAEGRTGFEIGPSFLLLEFLMFPISTFVISTYLGALGALILTTLYLGIVFVKSFFTRNSPTPLASP